LDGHVRLLGWQSAEEIWTLLRESDVLLLPSNFEGMPVVVMEALSAGCAVVASRVSGIEDIDAP
jgi:glycosyltransferase involved in cell wall biosynthesis